MIALTAVALTVVALTACAREQAHAPSDSTHAAAVESTPAPVVAASPSASSTDTVRAASAHAGMWRASARGVGVVRFGMPLDSAARIAGGTVAHPPGGSCGFVSLRDAPHGARLMVSYDTVVRVDVDSATVPTDAGARVGMTEDSVQHLYAGRLRVRPRTYVRSGHDLVSIPGAPADTMHQIIFVTDGDRVTRYRAGLAPYVASAEGCG